MGETLSKLQNTADGVRQDMAASLAAVTNMAIGFQHDASGTIVNITNELKECLRTITHRADHTAFLITNAVLAVAATIALGLLLRLTSFSPFLRSIVWTMFASLCLHMVLTYVRHSRSLSRPTSQQQAALPQHENHELEETILQLKISSELDLFKRQLTDEDMKTVATQVIINKQCAKLRLGWNNITSIGASILADALLNNYTLDELSLWNNRLCDAGVQSLAKILAIDRNNLKRLDLSENGITDVGVGHVAQMLKANRILTHLSLGRNKISNQGVRSLVDALKERNKTLETLSLSENKLVTDLSIDALIDMIKNNRSLRKLWVNDCNLSQTGQAKLKKAATSKKNFKVYL